MTLSAGTALQNGKYIIQTVLDQTEPGATYQAFHTFLERSVILQTLLRVPLDRDELTNAQQQFMNGVRRLMKEPHPASAKVIDCFTDAGFPFVVFEHTPGVALPLVGDWLKAPVHPQPTAASELEMHVSAVESPQAIAIAAPPQPNNGAYLQQSPSPNASSNNGAVAANEQPPLVKPELSIATNIPTVAVAPGIPHSVKGGKELSGGRNVAQATQVVKRPAQPPNAPSNVPPKAPSNASSAANPFSVGKRVVPSQGQHKRHRRVIPIALAATSIVAGLAGASFGWMLRFQNPGETRTTNEPVFSREQNFPPLDNWAGDDPSNARWRSGGWQPERNLDVTPQDAIAPADIIPDVPQPIPAEGDTYSAPVQEDAKEKPSKPDLAPPLDSIPPPEEKVVPAPDFAPEPAPVPLPDGNALPEAPPSEEVPKDTSPTPPPAIDSAPKAPEPSAYEGAPTLPSNAAPVLQ